MPIDSTNYGREMKKLRDEIAEMKNEVAFMYSAMQDIQEQFGLALAEIATSIKNLSQETQKKFDTQTESVSVVLKKFTELQNQSTKISEQQDEQAKKIADLMNENVSRLEKTSETQQLNFRNYFDKINNALNAQQKLFGDNFSEKISAVEKTLKKFPQQNDAINKNLFAMEELLRLIAANQMLSEVEKNLPQKNKSTEKVAVSNNNSWYENFSSSRMKKIFIYGRKRVGKSTLLKMLQKNFSGYEFVEVYGVDDHFITDNWLKSEFAIFVIDLNIPSNYETGNFERICRINKKIMLVINVKSIYEWEKDSHSRRRQVKNTMDGNYKYIYDTFKNRCSYYLDSNKVITFYVHLKAAEISQMYPQDDALLQLSNFPAIENFINNIA